MEISFGDLRNKEIINLNDGSRMGHIVDIVFNSENGKILGIFVPGERKLFKKSGDLFIPLEKIRRIGDDVILIRFENPNIRYDRRDYNRDGAKMVSNRIYKKEIGDSASSYIRYRKLDNKKYK